MLIGALYDESSGSPAGWLTNRPAIGLSRVLTPKESGTLYLTINEAASGLADNQGTLSVEIRPN